MSKATDIIRDENLTTEQKNAALKAEGITAYSLDDNANVITDEEEKNTYTGYSSKEANGWGYLFTGGIKAKVHVVNGVIQGGCGGDPTQDYVEINGNRYAVDGDNLID